MPITKILYPERFTADGLHDAVFPGGPNQPWVVDLFRTMLDRAVEAGILGTEETGDKCECGHCDYPDHFGKPPADVLEPVTPLPGGNRSRFAVGDRVTSLATGNFGTVERVAQSGNAVVLFDGAEGSVIIGDENLRLTAPAKHHHTHEDETAWEEVMRALDFRADRIDVLEKELAEARKDTARLAAWRMWPGTVRGAI